MNVVPASAPAPDTPANTIPSKTTGLEYVSDPVWVSMVVCHTGAPVPSSRATMYGLDFRFTVRNTRPSITVGDDCTGSGTCVLHTTSPVSALSAKTAPPSVEKNELASVATKTQPSAIAGVLLKVPVAPCSVTENTHAGASAVARPGVRTLSWSW